MKRFIIMALLVSFLYNDTYSQNKLINCQIRSVQIECFDDNTVLQLITELDLIAQEFAEFVSINNNGKKRLVKIMTPFYTDRVKNMFENQENLVSATWAINIDGYTGVSIPFERYSQIPESNDGVCSINYINTEIGDVGLDVCIDAENKTLLYFWHNKNSYKIHFYLKIDYCLDS